MQNKAYWGSLVNFLYCLKLSKTCPTDLLIKKQAQWYNRVEVHQSALQFDYTLREIGNRVRGCQ